MNSYHARPNAIYNTATRAATTRGMSPTAEVWMLRGLCKWEDPALFHPAQGGRHAIAEAKATCADCPVRDTCLDFALDNYDNLGPGRWGVWGGTSEGERKVLRQGQRKTAA